MSDQVHDTERWFIKRGVPHFIASYNAREDVFTRALPFLIVAFLFSAISAIDLEWPWWGIALAIGGGLGLLIGIWGLINRGRGRAPMTPPTSVGGVELAVFVLVPAVLPLVFGGDLAGVGITVLAQLVVLAVVYVVTSYGLVAISRWAAGQMIRSLAQTVRLFTRGLPLLLLGFMFLFINAEAWQSAGRLDHSLLIAVIALFIVLAAVFLATQVAREVEGVQHFDGWDEVAPLLGETPLAGATSVDAFDPPRLSRREWGNVGLVVFVSQSFRIILVSALVAGFFVALGLLIIRPETIALWTGAEPSLMWREFTWFGQSIHLTEELVSVAVFLAGFAGLYFSVYTATDPGLRAEFFDDTVGEVRQTVAVRAAYRQLV
ncbi:MAG: hypothetical protein HKN93_01605 [Acidimicrobiia bacterium]|nr:hypothetical protein [Acidimicrobiia bacterium]